MRPEVETIEPLAAPGEVLHEMMGDQTEEIDALWFHVTALRLFGGRSAAGLGDAIQRLHIRPVHRRRRVRAPLWIC